MESEITNLREQISSLEASSKKALEQSNEDVNIKVALRRASLSTGIDDTRTMRPKDICPADEMGDVRIQSHH